MRRPRPKLTYANAVSTLALFLALSGGAVWAADKITSRQIGKGAVKAKNIAKGAVKSRNLAKNAVKRRNLAPRSVNAAKLAGGAVTTPKLANGAVTAAKLAAGANVVASATAGPVPVNQETPVDVPLNPPLTLTPVAGQVLSVHLEARGTLTRSGNEQCLAFVIPVINGLPALVGENLLLVAPDEEAGPLFAQGIPRMAATFPLGLTTPGQPQSLTILVMGDGNDCTATSAIDQIAVVVTQMK